MSQPTFEQNIKGIVDVIKHFYSIKFKGYRPYEYKGVEIEIYQILATSYTIQETIEPENLKYSSQEQGRSPLEEIVGKAFNLGAQHIYKTKVKEIEEFRDLYYSAFMEASGKVKELQAEIERLKNPNP